MSKPTIGLILGLWLVLCTMQIIGLDAFYFDRQLIEQQQYWRMLTAHFVHLNIKHLALNLAGLTLVLIIFCWYGNGSLWCGYFGVSNGCANCL